MVAKPCLATFRKGWRGAGGYDTALIAAPLTLPLLYTPTPLESLFALTGEELQLSKNEFFGVSKSIAFPTSSPVAPPLHQPFLADGWTDLAELRYTECDVQFGLLGVEITAELSRKPQMLLFNL